MPLLLSYKTVYTGSLEVDNAVKVRLILDKSILSIPYELQEDSKITGKITGFYQKDTASSGNKLSIPEIPVIFILKSASSALDSLYIEKESWYKIRDYGILPDNFRVDVLITHATIGTQKVEIFPKRNVEI